MGQGSCFEKITGALQNLHRLLWLSFNQAQVWCTAYLVSWPAGNAGGFANLRESSLYAWSKLRRSMSIIALPSNTSQRQIRPLAGTTCARW
jgi:hypothetical protein